MQLSLCQGTGYTNWMGAWAGEGCIFNIFTHVVVPIGPGSCGGSAWWLSPLQLLSKNVNVASFWHLKQKRETTAPRFHNNDDVRER